MRPENQTFEDLPGAPLECHPAWQLHDLQDGVLGLELKVPGAILTGDTIAGLERAVARAEGEGWAGIVIGARGENFSLGASLQTLADNIERHQWQEIDRRGRSFQQANLGLRQCKVPVVAATRGYTLGAGCEIAMHCDSIIAASNTQMGLVETRAGILPAAGGSKEITLRAGTPQQLCQSLAGLTRSQLSGSASQAFSLGYLDPARDSLEGQPSSLLEQARRRVLQLKPGYRPVIVTQHRILVSYAELCHGVEEMGESQKLSRYDQHLAHKIAWVMSGGDRCGQWVSIETLLELEREALQSLAREARTLARIRHLLRSGLVAEQRG